MRLIFITLTLLCALVLATCGDEHPTGRGETATSADASAHGQEARNQPMVASKWSPKFHNADCEWATKIKPDNLIGYESREEAARDGRQPCGACRP